MPNSLRFRILRGSSTFCVKIYDFLNSFFESSVQFVVLKRFLDIPIPWNHFYSLNGNSQLVADSKRLSAFSFALVVY